MIKIIRSLNHEGISMNCVIRRIVSSSLRVEELQAFINRGRAMGKQGQRIDTDLCA